MISHFPILYPGELLYSGCARFSDRMKYPTIGATTTELFGSRQAVPAVDLPHKLDHLVTNLSAGHIYTADILIDQHTLLPLYAPFLPIQNYARLRASMRGGGSRTTNTLAGIAAGRVQPPMYLRTCPCCDAENIKRYGETYWHRLHQIPGVVICPYHNVFLQDTNVRRLNSKSKHTFHTAQHADRSSKVLPVDSLNHDHVLLATMAHIAAGIIDKPRQPEGPQALLNRYEARLQANDYFSLRGHIRLRDLRNDVVTFFSAPLFARLQSDLPDGKEKDWLTFMFSPRERISAPLRHLLLMTFFGDTADSFFDKTSTAAQPVEARCYPCLNVVCPAYGQPLIKSLEYKLAKGDRRKRTLFRCPTCGHTSARSEDGKQMKWVYDRGQLWKEKLKLLWNDASICVAHFEQILDADRMTIKRLAVKAGLPFPRLCRDRRGLITLPPQRKAAKSKFTVEARRFEYLALRKAQPAATGRQLRASHAGLVTWLYVHDREWMLKHVPRDVNRARPKTTVNWPARDKVVSAQVTTVAMQIKNAPGKPQRASRTAIEREVRCRLKLQFDLVKMPLTRLALHGAVETTVQFGLRRIHYVAQRFVAYGVVPTRADFLRAAGINTQRVVSGIITDAIDGALAQIKTAIENPPS